MKTGEFKTTDFYTIAVLYAYGFSIRDIKGVCRGNHMKAVVFEDSPELKETLLRHHNGELEVNTKVLISAIEHVKGMIRFDSTSL